MKQLIGLDITDQLKYRKNRGNKSTANDDEFMNDDGDDDIAPPATTATAATPANITDLAQFTTDQLLTELKKRGEAKRDKMTGKPQQPKQQQQEQQQVPQKQQQSPPQQQAEKTSNASVLSTAQPLLWMLAGAAATAVTGLAFLKRA